MADYHKMWIEQCEAACRIKENWGIRKALGYLIGEKLVNFVRVSDQQQKFAEELPEFVAEIKRLFQPWEIHEYLDNVHRIGTLGHVCTDEDYEVFRDAGAVEEDVVTAAEEVILMERVKELLLT